MNPLKIVESDACVTQFRFPKSRKKRIRRKWAACSANFRPSPTGYLMGDLFICHPVMAAKLRQHCREA